MNDNMADVAAFQNVNQLSAWDPLQSGSDDPEFVLAAQKREIRNILKSYTGYYDLFSELIQNAFGCR
ncbi:MAG TPA: hypothetical protein VFE38_02060 [Edaphobacter sp.]|nr:hypothetical protein [Edaphobacter sp.]